MNIILLFIVFIILIHISFTIFLKSVCVFTNKNSLIQILLWIIALILYNMYNNILFILLPLFFFIINEFLFWNYNIDFYDGPARTQLFYDITTANFIKNNNQTSNLTEGMYLHNLYDNESIMTIDEAKQLGPIKANEERFDKIFIYLELDKLSKYEISHINLLDIGCGNGNFLLYCKKRGLNTTGLTISPQQQKYCQEQGLNVYTGDYKNFHTQLTNNFDIITCIGCLEHITTDKPCSGLGIISEEENRKKIFNYIQKYFKKNSPFKYCFFPTLHINPMYCNTKEAYIVERAYGGWYHIDVDGQRIFEKVTQDGFNIIKNDDMTYHYLYGICC